MEETLKENNSLTLNMNLITSNMIFYLQKNKINEIKSVNDIIKILPIIISNIELLMKSTKGEDKKDVCKAVISTIIIKLVKDEDLEKQLLDFLNNNSDTVINSLVYMANFTGKIFNKKNLCFCLKKSRKRN